LTRRTTAYLPLFVGLFSLCLLAYSGAIESGDGQRLLDAVRSWVDWGDLRLDLSNWQTPSTIAEVTWFPLEDAGVEPGQVIAAAPLYLLARLVPGIGVVHTIWLFNALVTAAAGVLLTVYARALNASRGAALLLAVVLVGATALYPYSKTFFREPLTLLLFLFSAYAAHRLRVSGYQIVPLIGCGVALTGLLLTRGSALLAFPALLTIAAPAVSDWGNLRRAWRDRRVRAAILGLIVVGAIGIGVLIIFGAQLGLGSRYDVIARLVGASGETMPTALAAYLLSPGGSLWGTSPILLLAIPGAWLAVRRRAPRQTIAAVLAVGAFAVGYAIFNGRFWFGGLSWTPRFLIPVIPLVLLVCLPVFERAVARPLSLWGALVTVLIAYGVWINFTAVSLPLGAYARALPPESGGFLDWAPGLYDPAYFRWMLLPGRWSQEPSDLAWTLIDVPVFYSVFGVLALSGVYAAWRGGTAGRRWLVAVALTVGCVVTTAAALNLLHTGDPRYQPNQPELDALLPILERETARDDVILLSSPRNVRYFQNRAVLNDAGRVITLELQPGERPSEAEPALLQSDYAPALLTKETHRLITNLATTRDRLWLLVDGSPDLWWSVRPVERFMSAYYYPIRTIQTGDLTRLIEFDTAIAPDPFGFRGAEIASDLRFGDSLRLTGVTLSDESAAPGDSIGVTLWWTTDSPLTARYTVALYLRTPDGAPITQNDSAPLNGFSQTDSWLPGVPMPDHRGLRLPSGLAPGNYPLWVKVYDYGADGAPRDLPVTAGESLDGAIGVLPITISVG